MTNLSDTLAALKPCPFCGGAKVLVSQTIDQMGPNWYATCCQNTCAFIGYFVTQAEAIAAWNTRTGQLAPVPSVERIARVVADYQMSVGLPPDDAWEDADGIATAVIAAMKEGRE